jgi:hypothetical protein
MGSKEKGTGTYSGFDEFQSRSGRRLELTKWSKKNGISSGRRSIPVATLNQGELL